MSYLAVEVLQPKTFIYASNAEALVVQSATSNTKIAILSDLDNVFYLATTSNVFSIQKNSNVIVEVNDQYLDVQQTRTRQLQLSCNVQLATSNSIFQLTQNNQTIFSATYDNGPKFGIGTNTPTHLLDVRGDIFTTGTLIASNINVYGDTIIIDAVTSNSEQVRITNKGTGPALFVTQEGPEPIAEFYDDHTLSLIIADGGYIGIGTNAPQQSLDVRGNTIISGNIGIGTTNPQTTLDIIGDLQISGVILQNGNNYLESNTPWVVNPTNSNIYYTTANVGIGTTTPTQKLTIHGKTLITDQLISTLPTDTPPFQVASTTQVQNLNVSFLEGRSSSYFQNIENITSGILPISQGGTGNNSLTSNKLLVASQTDIFTPTELHWTGTRLGIGTTQPQESLHLTNNLRLDASLILHSQTDPTQSPTTLSLTPSSFSISYSNATIALTSNALTFSPTTHLLPPQTDTQTLTPGALRYNPTLNNFEASTTSQWVSITELISPDRSNYILPQDTHLAFYTSNTSRLTITQQGNLGIGTTDPQYTLHLNATDAFPLPTGTTTQRPNPIPGLIRYNTNTERFEGYGSNNQWQSLSDVRSTGGTTYITPEEYAGANDDTLRFYTANTQRLTIAPSGNIGIGTSDPQYALHVNQDLYASNLITPSLTATTINATTINTSNYVVSQIFSYLPDNISTRLNTQIKPASSNLTISSPTDTIPITFQGVFSVDINNTDLFHDGQKLTPTTDYQISTLTTPTTTTTTFTLTPQLTSGTLSIRIFPSYLSQDATLLPGYVIQNIEYNYWTQDPQTSNLYAPANVGIGTTSAHAPLHVNAQAKITTLNIATSTTNTNASNLPGAYIHDGPLRGQGSIHPPPIGISRIDLGTSNDTPTILFEHNTNTYQTTFDTNTLTTQYNDSPLLQLTPSIYTITPHLNLQTSLALNTNTTPPPNTFLLNGNLGIGTTTPQAALHLAQNTHAFLQGNLGIGTLPATHALHVAPPARFDSHITIYGNVGIGTTTDPQYPIDVYTPIQPATTQTALRITTPTTTLDTNSPTLAALDLRMLETAGTLVPTSLAKILYGTQAATNLYGTGYNNNGILQFQTANDGTLSPVLTLTGYGNVGIGTTLPQQTLHLNGTQYISNGNLGIGTHLPTATLSLHGSQYISQQLAIGSTTLPSPTTALNVTGDAYINGNTTITQTALFTSNTTFTHPTLFTSNATFTHSALFTTTLGIGTTDQSQNTTLDIHGTTLIQNGNLGIGTIQPLTPFHLLGSALIQNGTVGIGTTLPQLPFHVHSDAYIHGNLGIGTTLPQATLDLPTGSIQSYHINSTTLSTAQAIGITTTPHYQFQTYSPLNALVIDQGRLAISRTHFHPTTDLEIRNSSNIYTGILLRSQGNVNPTASLRIQSSRFDTNPSPAYAASIGLARYNDNGPYITKNTPLAAIHFGGNHTNNNPTNIAYAASVQAIAEDNFHHASNLPTAIVFYTRSNAAYQYNDPTYTPPQESLRISSTGNVGINTSIPQATLHVQGSLRVQDPSGPYYLQSPWSTPAALHTIPFPAYCLSSNSAGTLHLQIKNNTHTKLGNISLSYLVSDTPSVDIFSIYYHKNSLLTTLTVTPQAADIQVTTDNDCKISWQSIGAV